MSARLALLTAVDEDVTESEAYSWPWLPTDSGFPVPVCAPGCADPTGRYRPAPTPAVLVYVGSGPGRASPGPVHICCRLPLSVLSQPKPQDPEDRGDLRPPGDAGERQPVPAPERTRPARGGAGGNTAADSASAAAGGAVAARPLSGTAMAGGPVPTSYSLPYSYFRDTLHGVNAQATTALAYWTRTHGGVFAGAPGLPPLGRPHGQRHRVRPVSL